MSPDPMHSQRPRWRAGALGAGARERWRLAGRGGDPVRWMERSEIQGGPTKILATQPLHPDPWRDAGEPSAGGTPAPPRPPHPRDLGWRGPLRGDGRECSKRSAKDSAALLRCTAARCRRHSRGDPGNQVTDESWSVWACLISPRRRPRTGCRRPDSRSLRRT